MFTSMGISLQLEVLASVEMQCHIEEMAFRAVTSHLYPSVHEGTVQLAGFGVLVGGGGR